MKAPKFPYTPVSAVVISDDEGHVVGVFFPQLRGTDSQQQRREILKYVKDLLAYNDITAFSVSEEDYLE